MSEKSLAQIAFEAYQAELRRIAPDDGYGEYEWNTTSEKARKCFEAAARAVLAQKALDDTAERECPCGCKLPTYPSGTYRERIERDAIGHQVLQVDTVYHNFNAAPGDPIACYERGLELAAKTAGDDWRKIGATARRAAALEIARFLAGE